MAIQLPPSGDINTLANAIETATATNQPLVLLPGVHYTKPGYNLSIPIGPHGLSLTGTAAAHIQRPDHSVGDNPLHRRDDNFGIFLVPSAPTTAEVAGIQWQTHQSGQVRLSTAS